MSFVKMFLRPIISEQKKALETPVAETTIVKAPIVETTVEEPPVETAPVNNTLIEAFIETLIGETLEETLADIKPIEETPVVETPVVETPVAETPVVEAPVVETPVAETPVAETPVAETPVAETPVAETPVAETPVAETPVVEAPVAETPVAETPSMTIESYFAKKNITVESSTKKATPPSISSLSFNIANLYSHAKPFIQYIRECITKKNFQFTFNIKPFSSVQQQKMVELAYLLDEHGILSMVHHDVKSANIYGRISSAPNIINFITGGFLEIFTRCVAVNVLKTSAEIYNCDYEILTNVKIINGTGEKHELDVVIRLGENVFIIEAKSGKFDPDHYRKVGKTLGFVPDKLLLLAADKAPDLCDSISYFYEYYTANIETFRNSLIAMINDNLSNK